MRLLLILFASSGFVVFSFGVSRLLFALRVTTGSRINQFNVSTVLLNAKSYSLAGYSFSTVKKTSESGLQDLAELGFHQFTYISSCGQGSRLAVSWKDASGYHQESLQVPSC